MSLTYTQHAELRLNQRNITKPECELAVTSDKEFWTTKLKAGDHLRFTWPKVGNNCVTVITDKSGQRVVTVFKGAPTGWDTPAKIEAGF